METLGAALVEDLGVNAGGLYAPVSFLKIGGEMEGDEKEPSEVKPGGSTPSLYALPEGAKELQDLIEHRNMNFAVGNMFKACYRLEQKDGVDAAYDLRKILFFAERELRRVEAMNGQPNS